jgi:DNA (cytosine-5)-methyltransferase 1
MNHIDLFSGIGGFALAAKEVWGDDYHNLFFCDNNIFCQEVLRKNFGKEILIYGDIRLASKERFIADTASQRCDAGSDNRQRGQIQNYAIGQVTKDKSQRSERFVRISKNIIVDLLTGGFPCQPFSCAGKRKGTNDDRHLWSEMLRVIKDFSPRWIIAENVRGLINIQDGVVFEQVCLDLEAENYEVQPFIIPACAVNAPHRRDRIWIVANSRCEYGKGNKVGGESAGTLSCKETAPFPQRSVSNDSKGTNPDTESGQSRQPSEQKRREDISRGNISLPNARRFGQEKQEQQAARNEQYSWNQNWLEVATRLCSVDDGLPGQMGDTTLSKSRHRVEQLKAYGNAIVPQCVMPIMEAIKSAEENQKEG